MLYGNITPYSDVVYGSRINSNKIAQLNTSKTEWVKHQTNRPLKSTGNRPLKGTGNRPLKERVARIRELEADFSKREEKGVKEWMAFIKQGWSAILAEKVGFELDYYYSAEQCAVNLVGRGPTGPADSLAA